MMRSVLLVGLGVAVVACGGNGSSPASPTPTVPGDSDNAGGANLAIAFRPDPVPGSLVPCTGAFWRGQTPSWSMDEVLNETRGVGFTVKVETENLYNQDGVLIFHFSFPEDYYFAPNSEFVEDGCVTLGGAASGLLEEIMEGVDDKGNRLTFASRVRLLPVAVVSPGSNHASFVPMPGGMIRRAMHRVR